MINLSDSRADRWKSIALVVNCSCSACIQVDTHSTRGQSWFAPRFVGIGQAYIGGYSHATVYHYTGQYVRRGIQASESKSVWAFFKHGVHAACHHPSMMHMQCYVNELNARNSLRPLTATEGMMVRESLTGRLLILGSLRVLRRKARRVAHARSSPRQLSLPLLPR